MAAGSALIGLGAELVRVAFGSPCVVCEGELPVRRRVASCCVDCWSVLPRLDDGRCRRCAIPMPAVTRGNEAACLRCVTEPLDADWIDSWGRYDSGLTKVLQAFKFGGHAFLAEPLADLLAVAIHARADAAFDAIVPVPMFPAKERKRGYNQASLLAKSLAKTRDIPCVERMLRKVEERRTQSNLKKEDRRGNVKGTFVASEKVRGRSILLVDDICTTGETLSACAAALRAEGALNVAAVTVARTP